MSTGSDVIVPTDVIWLAVNINQNARDMHHDLLFKKTGSFEHFADKIEDPWAESEITYR